MDEEILDHLVRILSSTASQDALKILMAASDGIESSTRAIRDLGLTQKRYYTWLKRLMDIGLIEKSNGVYGLTTLGKYCLKLGAVLSNIVKSREKLELADKLMRSDTLSLEEKEKFLGMFLEKELIGSASLADMIHEVKMITSYDAFIEEVIEMMGYAKEVAYIAARNTDIRVIDSMTDAAKRGVNLLLLSSREKPFREKLDALKLALKPELIRMLKDWFSIQGVTIRSTDLSYNFCVVDGEYGVLELQHPGGANTFFAAFKFRNKSFCKKMIDIFNQLCEDGKEDPLMKYLRKVFSYYK